MSFFQVRVRASNDEIMMMMMTIAFADNIVRYQGSRIDKMHMFLTSSQAPLSYDVLNNYAHQCSE